MAKVKLNTEVKAYYGKMTNFVQSQQNLKKTDKKTKKRKLHEFEEERPSAISTECDGAE